MSSVTQAKFIVLACSKNDYQVRVEEMRFKRRRQDARNCGRRRKHNESIVSKICDCSDLDKMNHFYDAGPGVGGL